MKKSFKNGFSFVELSIVLVITGILGYGAFTLQKVQQESSDREVTVDRMNDILDAIQLYYSVHGALPCPANATYPESHADFGKAINAIPEENAAYDDVTCDYVNSTVSDSYIGMLPVKNLDLRNIYSHDAWGTRFTYVVAKKCVDPDNWVDDTKNKCTVDGLDTIGGTIIIEDNSGAPERTTQAVLALISHGRNKLGGWGKTGTPSTPSTYAYELENIDNDDTFRDDVIFDPDTLPATYFDDIVIWKTGPQIQYREDN